MGTRPALVPRGGGGGLDPSCTERGLIEGVLQKKGKGLIGGMELSENKQRKKGKKAMRYSQHSYVHHLGGNVTNGGKT